MVWALMQTNNLIAPTNEEGHNQAHNSSPRSTEAWPKSDKDEPSFEGFEVQSETLRGGGE